MADDLGWGDLACYGNREIKTPNLDRLRSEGVLATQYYSCGCVCSPSRAAFLTGRYPASLGVHKAIQTPQKNAAINQVNFVHWDTLTVADVFKARGYTTAHFGKWHLGSKCPDCPPWPGTGGPLNWLHLSNYGFDISRCSLCAAVNDAYDRQPDPNNPGAFYDPPERAWLSSDWIVDDAIAFLETHMANPNPAPVYVQLWLKDPHAPNDPTPDQVAEAGYKDAYGTPEILNGWTSSRLNYYTVVTHMDAQIGRFLDAIDSLGMRNNTLIVFTSDNGPARPWANNTDHSGSGHTGPFRGGKHSLYEGGVRVPLIVRWPGYIPAGSTSDHPMAAVDWLPTFAAIVHYQTPELDGESIIAPLVLPGSPWFRSTEIYGEWRFGNTGEPQRSVIDISPGAFVISPCGRWKLYRNRDGNPVGKRLELYYLPDDPSELNNVAQDHPGIVEEMEQKLLACQAGLPACIGCGNEGDNRYPWP